MSCGHHPLDDSALTVTLETRSVDRVIISRMDPITAA